MKHFSVNFYNRWNKKSWETVLEYPMEWWTQVKIFFIYIGFCFDLTKEKNHLSLLNNENNGLHRFVIPVEVMCLNIRRGGSTGLCWWDSKRVTQKINKTELYTLEDLYPFMILTFIDFPVGSDRNSKMSTSLCTSVPK